MSAETADSRMLASRRTRAAGTVLILLGAAWTVLLGLGTAAMLLGSGEMDSVSRSWIPLMATWSAVVILVVAVPRIWAGVLIRRGSRRARLVALVLTSIWLGLGALQVLVALTSGGSLAFGELASADTAVLALPALDMLASAFVVWALATTPGAASSAALTA